MSEPQEAEVAQWFLVENVTYREACRRIQRLFGIKVSPPTLHTFWHDYIEPIIRKREGKYREISKPNPRSSSLHSLKDHQFETLKQWLVNEAMGYQQARKQLKDHFGINTSVYSLATWYHRFCGKTEIERQERRRKAFLGVQHLEIEIEVNPGGVITGKAFPLSPQAPARMKPHFLECRLFVKSNGNVEGEAYPGANAQCGGGK